MSETSQSDTVDESTGSVVMLSGDLIFSSRVKAAAERAGLQFRVAGNLPDDCTDSIRFVVLDLSTRSKLTDEIVEKCNERCPQAKLIAYGPHVQIAKLGNARAAGITMVMTNGQFDSQLPQIFS
jgi:hypothetical protein